MTEYLRGRGHSIQQVVRQPAALPPPAPCPSHLVDDRDMALLHLVQLHDRGLIEYAAGRVDPAWLIAQVARA